MRVVAIRCEVLLEMSSATQVGDGLPSLADADVGAARIASRSGEQLRVPTRSSKVAGLSASTICSRSTEVAQCEVRRRLGFQCLQQRGCERGRSAQLASRGTNLGVGVDTAKELDEG